MLCACVAETETGTMKQHMMMMIVIKVNIDFNHLAFGILDELACVHVECHHESERKK